jgi:hypothetical protein
MAIEILRRPRVVEPDETPCVMQCGRRGCGMRVDGKDLCAHCFIATVEIVAHELGAMRRAAAASGFTGAADPPLYTALARVTLPSIEQLARQMGAARGERRGRDDPSPATCDAES